MSQEFLDDQHPDLTGHPPGEPPRGELVRFSGYSIDEARDTTEEAPHRDVLLRSEMAELRLRTALELHDGILQTLTGAALQIAVARKLVRTDPDAAEKILQTLGDSVAAEQMEMRLYVDEIKGRSPVWTDGVGALPGRVEAALDRVGSVWGLTTSADVHIPREIGGELGRQVVRIVQEATVNATRHGAAENVAVSVSLDGSDVVLTVTDDGTGFPFKGEYDHEELKQKRLGPLSLKHRVEAAGGRISIDSRSDGATVTVRIPVPRRAGSS